MDEALIASVEVPSPARVAAGPGCFPEATGTAPARR
jgi:hypothetical protein